MAQNKGYMAKIGLDTSDVDKQIRSLNSELKQIDRAMKENGESAVLNSQKYTVLSEQIAATEKKLEQLTAQQKIASDALKNGQISTSEYRAFEREIEKTTAQLDNMNKELKEMEKNSNGAGQKLSQFADMLKANLASAAIQETIKLLEQLGQAAVDMVKDAAAAYGQYEQLVGGVETLFGDAGQTVVENAQKAFTTAGVSANKYMEQVTSFSASLINSLAGDTEAAAALADQAIIDMSDNANKMGTGMSSIQNAYQGFAKQNYTMLDNLKLGYGGTKTEMERLISDANKLKEANGEAGDLTIQKFSDVVEAIHLVQDELGIVNATRDEALTTIEGSAGAAQAAWENLLTGIADPAADLGQLLDDFVNSKMVEMDNLIPTIEHSIEGIGDAIEKLLPKVSAGSEVFEKLTDELGTKAPELLIGLGESLIKALPLLADAALSIAEKLITSVADQMPELIPDLVETIGNLLSVIISHADELVTAGLKLIKSLSEGLLSAIPQLLVSAGQVVTQLIESIGQLVIDGIPKLMGIGDDTCDGIAQGLLEFDWSDAVGKAVDKLSDSFKEQLKNNEDLANLFGYETADALDAKLAEAEARLAESKAVREEAKREAAEAETAAKAIDKKTQGIRDAAEAQAAAYKAASESERGKALAEVTGKIDLSRMENAWDRIYHWDKENYEEYWEEQRKWLEEHKENTEEWWNAWNKNEEHYRKKAEDDEKARADEEKKRKDKLEKDRKAQADAENERIKQQKEAIDDAFKELEIQKKNEGKDQGWLLEQERAYIDALDKSSDLYKEYDQKWRSSWADWKETRRKEEKEAFKKAQETRIKETKALIKEGKAAAEKLAAEYAKGQQSIMDAANNPTRVTDINGEDRLVFTDFSKKIQQLKKYQQNLDKLSGLGLSEQHLRDIFAMDLDTRMKYIEELLRMSESGRQAYLNDYEKYYAMAGQTAKTETKLSGRESELMEESINTALDDIADNSYVMGKQAKEEWLKGWNEGGGGALGEPYIEQLYGKGSAAAQTSPDISGNVTINIAGQNVIQTTMTEFFRAIKNSGGTLDI